MILLGEPGFELDNPGVSVTAGSFHSNVLLVAFAYTVYALRDSTLVFYLERIEMTGQQWDTPPEMQIDVSKEYSIKISTDRGAIELALYPEHAPQTVNNFVFLAKQGFYDGVTFHRVIADFMIQGGDPTGSGSGGPGYRFADECVGNPLRHEAKVISMANAGPNTNGSQFFITHLPTPHLDGRHTVFGKVTSGEDVVDAIEQGDTMISVEVID
jgi:peptidyl-prolyl cis-trans isomerase B (cyclophilin B)